MNKMFVLFFPYVRENSEVEREKIKGLMPTPVWRNVNIVDIKNQISRHNNGKKRKKDFAAANFSFR